MLQVSTAILYQYCYIVVSQYPRRYLRADHEAVYKKYSKDILDSQTLTLDVDANEYILLQSLIVSCVYYIVPKKWKYLCVTSLQWREKITKRLRRFSQ